MSLYLPISSVAVPVAAANCWNASCESDENLIAAVPTAANGAVTDLVRVSPAAVNASPAWANTSATLLNRFSRSRACAATSLDGLLKSSISFTTAATVLPALVLHLFLNVLQFLF